MNDPTFLEDMIPDLTDNALVTMFGNMKAKKLHGREVKRNSVALIQLWFVRDDVNAQGD